MLLQRLARVALFLTSVAVVNKGVWEMLRLDVVANIAPAGVAEGAADVARVTKVPSFNELVKLGRAGRNIVEPYQESSNQYELAQSPLDTIFLTLQANCISIPF